MEHKQNPEPFVVVGTNVKLETFILFYALEHKHPLKIMVTVKV